MVVTIIFHKGVLRSNEVSDELTFSASDNDNAPGSPIPRAVEYDTIETGVKREQWTTLRHNNRLCLIHLKP